MDVVLELTETEVIVQHEHDNVCCIAFYNICSVILLKLIFKLFLLLIRK